MYKKLLTVTCLVALAVTMTGCDTESALSSVDTFSGNGVMTVAESLSSTETSASTVEESSVDSESSDTSSEEPLILPTTLVSEAERASGYIILNGIVYTPTDKVSKLLDNGWEWTSDCADLENKVCEPGVGDIRSGATNTRHGFDLSIEFLNLTREPQLVRDCTLHVVGVDSLMGLPFEVLSGIYLQYTPKEDIINMMTTSGYVISFVGDTQLVFKDDAGNSYNFGIDERTSLAFGFQVYFKV